MNTPKTASPEDAGKKNILVSIPLEIYEQYKKASDIVVQSSPIPATPARIAEMLIVIELGRQKPLDIARRFIKYTFKQIDLDEDESVPVKGSAKSPPPLA